MNYRLGLDIGTTATKACAFDADGREIALVQRAYELYHPEPGAAVQDAETVFSAAEAALTELVAGLDAPPLSLGLSCPMHSVLLLDAAGQPFSPVYTWADTRGQSVMDEFPPDQRRDLHRRTGTPVHPMSPLVTLRWLARHRPAEYAAAAYASDLKSALVSRWTQDGLILDEQLASASGLMDLRASEWLPEVVELLGKEHPQLPEIRPANTRLCWQPKVAERLGLADVPLYLGGSDGVLANYGTGITACDQVAISVGTSAAVRTTHAAWDVDPEHGLFNYKLKHGRYAIGGATNNGGKVLEYWQRLLAAHYPDVGAFIDGAMSVDAAAAPAFVPFLNGERAPVWDAAAAAALTGLRGHHTPAHVARAVLEGVTGNIVRILRDLEAAVGPASELLIAGGVTQSPEWVALIGRRTGRPIRVAPREQAVAYGAAMVYEL